MISLLALTSLGAGAQNLQKGDYGYLYCHMSGRGEWTAYALSRDGVHFHDLIDGDPIYNVEEMSKIEGGARDAFICRTSDGKGYLMVTTDMSNAKSRSWFNYGINLLKSDDLIHWRLLPPSTSARDRASSVTLNRPTSIRTTAPSSAYGHRRFSGTLRTYGPMARRADT